MLASILPGLREIRTPLTVGYAWLLVAFLAVGYRLPDMAAATGVLADLYRIGGVLTPAGIAVLASVVAYLLGIVVVPVTAVLVNRIRRWRANAWPVFRLLSNQADERVEAKLAELAGDRLADRIRVDPVLRADLVRFGVDRGAKYGIEVDATRLEQLLTNDISARNGAVGAGLNIEGRLSRDKDLPRMTERLRRNDEQAGISYDRLTSEAEFRGGMAWPVLGLIAVLSIRSSPWFLAGLPAVLMLLRASSAALLEAHLLVITALDARRSEDPALQALDGIPAAALVNDDHEDFPEWITEAAPKVTVVAISADGGKVAAGTRSGLVVVWDTASGEVVSTLVGHRGDINGAAFSRDGRLLATAGDDGSARVWDVTTREEVHGFANHGLAWRVFFAADGEHLVVIDSDQAAWHRMASRTRTRAVELGDASAYAIDLNSAGRLLARGREQILLSDGDRLRPVAERADLRHVMWLDDRRFVTDSWASEGRQETLLWELETEGGTKVKAPVQIARSVNSIQMALASAGTAAFAVRAGFYESAIIIEPVGRDPDQRTMSGTHSGSIQQLALSDDGSTLVSASDHGTVVVWDVTAMTRSRRLAPVPGRQPAAHMPE